MTFAVKDIFDVEATITGRGNPDWLGSHDPAAVNAPTVQALLDAGAQVVGKTITEKARQTRMALPASLHFTSYYTSAINKGMNQPGNGCCGKIDRESTFRPTP